MTAVIHHGAPGSYKTFALVQRVLIPALQSGRAVITNIRGFNDIDRIRSALNISIPDTAQIFYVEPNTEGYEAIAKFFHWAPAGALICMDEGQRVYPLRKTRFDHLDQPDNIPIFDSQNQPLIDTETGAYVTRPATLEIAIDQHRHFNWDIYISTPNIAKIHGEIRKCVEWAYRHRDNSGLLPWMKNSWSEFRHDSEQSGKSISHYSGAPKRYKADPRIFACYQSTATGTAKTTNENISIFRDTKLRVALALFIASFTYIFYAAGDAYDRITNPNGTPDTLAMEPSKNIPIQNPSVSPDTDIHVTADKRRISPVSDVNPFEGMTIYYTGRINDHRFFEVAVSEDRYLSITLGELEQLGFSLKLESGSFIAFDFNGRTIYAFGKPRAPFEEPVATMERTATQMSAGVL